MSTDNVCFKIPPDQIFPSETNPRKHFDQVKLEELAESLKKHGILEPLIVERRAVPKNLKRGTRTLPTYEIVAGERRYRAALLAGLKELPCVVHTLTVAQALEIKLIENLQREDLDPLEEAIGFDQLLKADIPAAAIAERVGKAKAYVYAALKLLQLPEGEAREALAAGRLPRETAVLIGRLPSEKLRVKALQEILHPTSWTYQNREELKGEIMSYRVAKEWIEEHCMVELKGAPFDRKALDLVPAAGSCEVCPKRTGNNPDEFPGARADVCTDPECYRTKEKAAHAARVAKLANSGVKVLPAGTAKKALATMGYNKSSAYIPLNEKIWQDEKKRTLKQLAGAQLAADAVAAIDERGNAHYFVPRDVAEDVLSKQGIDVEGANAHSSSQRDNTDWEKRNRIMKRFRERFIEECMFELDAAIAGVMGLGKGRLEDILLHMVVDTDWRLEATEKALGWSDGESDSEHQGKEKCTTARQALLALLLFCVNSSIGNYFDLKSTSLQAVAKLFKIDAAKLYEEAKKAVAAEQKAAQALEATPATNGKNGKHKKAAAAKS